MLAPFAHVGRMALTNYLMQSFIIGFVLFGVGPGLALAGKIGSCALSGIVSAGFRPADAVQPLVAGSISIRTGGMAVARVHLRHNAGHAPYTSGSRRVNQNKMLICALAVLAFAMRSTAADSLADCQGVTDIKSKSRTHNKSSTLMVSLLTLEKQGEANFTPAFTPPASQCVLERFEVAGAPVTTVYSPFEKGQHTLHYRFLAGSGDDAREILVVYDGLASLMAEKEVFLVVENRKGHISYYEMYREQPGYVALKPVITAIVDGSAQPLAKVNWPKGAKEPVIDAFDSKRLK